MRSSAASREAVDVRVPGDKSITHRALILASLAAGESRVRGALAAADTRATVDALRALGVEIDEVPDAIRVRGGGLRGWREPDGALDCRNSGTTARLLLGALAGNPFPALLSGDESLRRRPMRRVTGPLEAAGARFEELEVADRLPIRVTGKRPLGPLDHESPWASAQVKTAMLLAGLTGGAPVRVAEPTLSRDHTERMLAAMGARVRMPGPGALVELDVHERLEPLDLTVPGDPSAAAFFLALGALLGPVRTPDVALNATRTGFLPVLRRMAVRVEVERAGLAEAPGPAGAEAGGEPVGDIAASPAELRGTRIEPAEVPALLDEIPVLAALAAIADGESRFDGLGELRVKETDRVAALVRNLRALGIEAEEGPTHMLIVGRPGRLRGRVQSFGDHRIAMAFGVLAAVPGNEIEIDGRDAVAVSYPGFWRELGRVRKELLES